MKNELANLRKIYNLTQEELGEKLFVSRQTINSIERGQYNPSLDLAFRMSNLFNKCIEEIFIYEEE